MLFYTKDIEEAKLFDTAASASDALSDYLNSIAPDPVTFSYTLKRGASSWFIEVEETNTGTLLGWLGLED